MADTSTSLKSRAKLAPKRSRFSIFRRFQKSDDGAAALEFALIAFPFFLMIGGILEFGVHYYAKSTLDHGMEEVARKVRTNQISGNTHTEAQFKAEICSLVVMSMFDCSKLSIDLQELGSFQDVAIPRNANGSLNTSGLGFNPGGRVSINLLRAYYEWPTFMAFHKISNDEVFSNGKRLMVSSKAFRIEP